MDRYVKNFIAASILWLGVAALLGLAMLGNPNDIGKFKFPHSHLMLLGWVSMMIYGVGYHILPKFAGKKNVKYPGMAEAHFWISNIGLVGMVIFYVMNQYNPEVGLYKWIMVASGIAEAVSIAMFFYNMIVSIYVVDTPPPPAVG